MRALVIVVALALVGCSQTWGKPGSTQAELDRDGAYCRMVAAGIQAPAPPLAVYPQGYETAGSSYAAASNSLTAMSGTFASAAMRQQTLEDCLISRGWIRTD